MNSILKKISLLMAASALMTGFTGCSEDDADTVSSSQDNIVLEQNVHHANFEIRSNTSWIAECITFDEDGNRTADNWFRITPSEGMGTKQISLDVNESNHSVKARQGQIKVTYSNGKTHLIAVSQRGLTDIETAVTPQQIGVGAKTSAQMFTVSVANRDARIYAEVISGDSWLKNLAKFHDLSFGYSRKEAWGFTADENISSDARKAEILVVVTFGYNTYEYIVTVTQDGLGAPAVMTAPTVYMNNAQTEHKQTIWAEGGDKTNVNFTPTWTSSYDGVGNAKGWITNVQIVNHELVITAEKNLDEAAREGVVTIVASRSANVGESAYATLSVKVSQAGYKSAGIVIPVAEVAYPAAEKACTQNLTLINQSTSESITTDNAAMFKVAPAIATGTSQLTYTLNAYDGAQGEYREGVITIVVSNKGSNKAIASLKVRQYAPTVPGISLPMQEIVLNSTAQTDLPLLLNALNDADIAVVTPTTGWLTAKMDATDKKKLLYTTTAYNGADGNYREGVIVLKASKTTYHDAAYYYITVRQYAPTVPGISLPTQEITVNSTAQTNLPVYLNALNGATIEVVSPTTGWLTAAMDATNKTQLNFTTTAYNGATGNYREAVITLKASKTGYYQPAYYYITVRQYAPDMPAISSLMPYIGLSSAASGAQSLMMALQNGITEVTASSSATWLTASIDAVNKAKLNYSAIAFTGGSAPDFCREAIITITAKNTHANLAYYYITVRQYGIQGASLPTFGTLSGWANSNHFTLVNGENVTAMKIDTSHGASRYCANEDPYSYLGSTGTFLTFSDIMTNSFHLAWSANNLPNEGEHTLIWRNQYVVFNLTLADQKNQVLTHTFEQGHN